MSYDEMDDADERVRRLEVERDEYKAAFLTTEAHASDMFLLAEQRHQALVAAEAENARIRSETIEECAQIAFRQECPAIGHLIRALAQPEERET